MKKMFFLKGFRSLLPMFFLLAGMLAFANRAEAQASVGPTPHNWVTVQQAIDNLNLQLENVLKPQLSQFFPGTPAYENAYNHAFYYKSVVAELMTGATVPAALETTLDGISVGSTGLKAVANAITLTGMQKYQLYNDAAAHVSL